jgi:hypothetical protein
MLNSFHSFDSSIIDEFQASYSYILVSFPVSLLLSYYPLRQPTPSSSTTIKCYIVKGGLAAAHAMKVHWRSGHIVLLIFNLGNH